MTGEDGMIKSKVWVAGHLTLVIGAFVTAIFWVVKVDPFFHYHKPDTDKYFYELDNERSQNDGITRRFDYDALITGTSMTENFKTTEVDRIFGTKSIKVPYSGGSYKEINDSLARAFEYNPELKTVIRGLDMNRFTVDKDCMRDDLGKYPDYLYDSNPFNDVQYVLNRDVIFKRIYPMITENDAEGFEPGITSFDEYSDWMQRFSFGIDSVCPEGLELKPAGEPVHLTETERGTVLGNVRQNVTSLAEQHPDVTFYYFFTPYSIMFWQDQVGYGTIHRQIEVEELVIEEILKCSNIRLYSFNNLTDITTDLNNYKDNTHYGSWVNSLMLRYMKDGRCLLTQENYKEYLAEELAFYTSYDYGQLEDQEDYENDYYAEALMNEEISGVKPLHFTEEVLEQGEWNKASLVAGQYNGTAGIECRGRLEKDCDSPVKDSDYIISTEYAGCKVTVEDIGPYRYLAFYGIKNADHGQPGVYICDGNNEILAEFTAKYSELDHGWHQYMIDVSELEGPVTIIFNGGYTDNTGSADSKYTFSNIALY